MKVNLNIEEDSQFRAEVKSLIEGQVRHVLREQLSGIVMGEIGKLKLLQPDSPSLSKLVEEEVRKTAQRQYGSASIQTMLREEIKKLLTPHAVDVRTEMITAMKALIK